MGTQDFQARYESSILSTRSLVPEPDSALGVESCGTLRGTLPRLWTPLALLILAFSFSLTGPQVSVAVGQPPNHHVVAATEERVAHSTATRSTTFSVLARRKYAIRTIFGRHGEAAIRVARCESGPMLDPTARNGQFLGTFQMGRRERARFGHGPGVWRQARAAYRYFRLAGWEPWSCRH